MSEIPKSLKERHNYWVEVVNAANIEGYIDLLAENVVWIPPGQAPVIGRKAFKEWLAPFMSVFAYDFSIIEEHFIVSGNWAFERARFISEMTPFDGGDSMSHKGSFSLFWKRDSSNIWYIERYIDDTEI